MNGVGNAGVLNQKDLAKGIYSVGANHTSGGTVVTGGDLRTKGSNVKGSAPAKK